MKRNSGVQRWTGVVLVGDGLAGIIWPREYLRKLEIGPDVVNNLLEALAARPRLTRVLCAMEVVVGAWIVVR